MLNNDWGMSAYPLVPGHEIVGEVVAVGEQARNVKIGDVVGVGWYSQSCMACSSCLSGDHNLCATSESIIVGRHGGFADRVRAHWGWVNKLPYSLDVSKAVSGSPLGSPATTALMLDFCARHNIAPVTKQYKMSAVNSALEHLEAGKARYRLVLENDFA